MIPMPPNAPGGPCIWTRAFLEATGRHEVPPPDPDEPVASQDPHDLYAAVHLHRLSALRRCDGRANSVHAGRGYRRTGSPGVDQQSDSDPSLADFLRSTYPADPGS